MNPLIPRIFLVGARWFDARIAVSVALLALLPAGPIPATTSIDDCEVRIRTMKLVGNANLPKSIFVFLDGTRNDPKSGTNVWRLYDVVTKNNDPQTTALYVEGVGSVDHPVFGAALGKGMEHRVLKGYEFITTNYHPGDHVYIFGFSRGAHTARALAGFLAYAGVPRLSAENQRYLITISNKLLDLTKSQNDEDKRYRKAWRSWTPGQAPPLAAEIKEKYQQDMMPVEVKLLGAWDTVPGSSFKKYRGCKEEIGFWKTWFWWLPMISKGERYKTDSYPSIHNIAHAVALDEKRSKFEPVLLCPPLNDKFTKTMEVWFPGAHADVGGGYEDSQDLADISLSWMLDLVSDNYKFTTMPRTFVGSALGVAHWSIGDHPANLGSDCEDRKPPQGAAIDSSVNARKQSATVPLRIEGETKRLRYPLTCADI